MPATKEAPGLACRRGVAYWIAPNRAVKRGFAPRTHRIPAGLTAEQIAEVCRRLQREAAEFLGGEERPRVAFDGSIGSLAELFQTHPLGPYKRKRRPIKWVTRDGYDDCLRIIVATVGGRLLHKLKAEDFNRWYENWRAPRKEGGPERVARAYAVIGMVRMLLSFGVMIEVPGAARAATILREMTFESPTPRKAQLVAAQVVAIRAKAHEMGRPSIALANALQFETALRQKDVIGEHAPDDTARRGESLTSARGGRRWTSGLVWGQHIDPVTLLMIKPTSKSRGKKSAEFDLNLCPMVLEELAQVPPERRIGPVIISETTGKPYAESNYRQLWREIASAAGIPDDVCNMHSRHGAENEAKLSGAHPMHIRNMMTHASLSTTMGYDQSTVAETRAVARLRAAHRNKA